MTERTWKRLWAAWYTLDQALDALHHARPREISKAAARVERGRERVRKAMATAAIEPRY